MLVNQSEPRMLMTNAWTNVSRIFECTESCVRLNDGVHVFVPATSTRICICWIDALALSIGIGVIRVYIAMGYSCRSSRSGSGDQSSYYVATAKEKSISWRVLPRTRRIFSFSRSRIIAISPNTSTRSVAEMKCAKVKSESGIG